MNSLSTPLSLSLTHVFTGTKYSSSNINILHNNVSIVKVRPQGGHDIICYRWDCFEYTDTDRNFDMKQTISCG